MKAKYTFRVERQGKRKTIEIRRPAKAMKPRPAVSAVARRLELAHFIDSSIENGLVRDQADAARRLGITRARMTQVMSLRWLPVEMQEGILLGELRPTQKELREFSPECPQEGGTSQRDFIT